MKAKIVYPTDKILKSPRYYDQYPDAANLLSELFEGEWCVSSFGDTREKTLRIDNTKNYIPNVTQTVCFFGIGNFGRHNCGLAFIDAMLYLDSSFSQDKAIGLTDNRKWVRDWYLAGKINNLKQNKKALDLIRIFYKYPVEVEYTIGHNGEMINDYSIIQNHRRSYKHLKN